MSGTDDQDREGLTALQRRWLARMHRFTREGGTMVAYAARHGLVLKQCYDWRCRLRKMGLLPSVTTSKQSFFKRVAVVQPIAATSVDAEATSSATINSMQPVDQQGFSPFFNSGPFNAEPDRSVITRLPPTATIRLPNGAVIDLGSGTDIKGVLQAVAALP